MNTERQHEQIVAERAAQLLIEVQSGGVNERTALMRWIKQSPLHVREMLVATAWENLLNALDIGRKYSVDELMEKSRSTVTPIAERRDVVAANASAEPTAIAAAIPIDAVPIIAAQAPRARSSKPWIGYAAVASILFAVALAGWTRFMSSVAPADEYETAVGEQRTVSLEDGSVVYLNTQSQVRVAFSRNARDIHLQGQAIFNVVHDASRPFRVHADHGQVQANGAQFDVNSRRDRTDIAVIDGLVSAITAGIGATPQRSSHVDLPAGKAMAIGIDGKPSSPEEVDVADIVAWRHRRLVFKERTLLDIATEFNRYNKAPKLRVAGEALQTTRYSGTFDADDPQYFLDYLARDRQLTFEHSGDEFVVIRIRSN